MGTLTIKMPDVGEGVAEAELVEWHVAVGDAVAEDAVLAAVMTDKATVEIPSPARGLVAWLGGEAGDRLAVGAPLIRLEVAGGEDEAEPRPEPAMSRGAEAGAAEILPRETLSLKPPISPLEGSEGRAGTRGPAQSDADKAEGGSAVEAPVPPSGLPPISPSRGEISQPRALAKPSGEKPLASPAVRRRALEAGVDLRRVAGSGPAGRVTRDDLSAFLEGGGEASGAGGRLRPDPSVTETRVVGLRRRIAERMALARDRIVPITYVEEIDVQALEDLRAAMNAGRREGRPKLTLLPFLVRALVIALRDHPAMNAHFDDEAGIVRRFGGVHVGIAAQTDAGLVVPVLRHAEALDLWGCAAEISRLAEAAKAGTARREELSGSTITITSLGSLGGIATTPIVNPPEIAILGVNRMEVRPVWDGARFVPRKRMNLSSSFDHRIVDGWDAAVFVQRIKALIETPAMIFAEG